MRNHCLTILLCSLGLTAQAEGKVDWSTELELGYGYDSNVAVDDVDLATETGDRFADFSISGGVSYEVSEGLALSADLLLSEKQYKQFETFDGRLSMVSLGVQRELKTFELGLSIRYIDYQLNNEGFLSLTQVSPTVAWFPTKKTYVRAAYEFSEESFDVESDRDNRQQKVSLRGYLFLNGLRKYFLARLQYVRDEAADNVFDNDASEIAVSYRQEFSIGAKELAMELGYRYQRRDYEEAVHPELTTFRHDRRRRFELQLTWPLSDAFTLVSKIHRNDYRSNLESADYDQQVYMLSLKYELR